MINAKDTFYLTLRDRLAALNPARTMGLRGVIRPGILVAEHELATDAVIPDIFRLQWTTLHVDAQGPLPLVTMTCEIRYTTAGTAGNGGMDRGRLLDGMDAELTSALQALPQTIRKQCYTSGAPVALLTNIFWNEPTFTAVTVKSERLERVAIVEVFAYQEAGE